MKEVDLDKCGLMQKLFGGINFEQYYVLHVTDIF